MDTQNKKSQVEVTVKNGGASWHWVNKKYRTGRTPDTLDDHSEITAETEPVDNAEKLLLKVLANLAANHCYGEVSTISIDFKGKRYTFDMARGKTITGMAIAIYSALCKTLFGGGIANVRVTGI